MVEPIPLTGRLEVRQPLIQLPPQLCPFRKFILRRSLSQLRFLQQDLFAESGLPTGGGGEEGAGVEGEELGVSGGLHLVASGAKGTRVD
jgi:hypothetical protein